MLLNRDTAEGIANGSITVVLRRWDAPRTKPGGTQRTVAGFADALAPESGDRLVRETLHRRAAPGEGVLELDRFAATLRDGGYDGTVSVEVLSAALRELPVDALVERLHGATAPYWL